MSNAYIGTISLSDTLNPISTGELFLLKNEELFGLYVTLTLSTKHGGNCIISLAP